METRRGEPVRVQVGQFGRGNADRLRRLAGEVRVHLEPHEVAADQQRRIRQVVDVAAEPDLSGVQVAARPLVLPRIGAALPDIGESLTAT